MYGFHLVRRGGALHNRPMSGSLESPNGLSRASWLPSPNCDARPAGCLPELLVVHCISLPPGQFGGGEITDLFLNRLDYAAHPYFESLRGLRVSAHFLIRRDGALLQFVDCRQRAWHAGQSRFCGRERCNDFSVGIELEGTEELPYEPQQYRCLAELVRDLRQRFPTLRAAPLVAHSDIAPGRKLDPGPAFDWSRLRDGLRNGRALENSD